MSVGEFVSDAWHRIQGELFPFLAEETALSAKYTAGSSPCST